MFVCNSAPCSRDHFFETFDVSLSSTTDASSVCSIKAIVSNKRYHRRPKSSVNNPISLLRYSEFEKWIKKLCSFRGISSKAILKKHTLFNSAETRGKETLL